MVEGWWVLDIYKYFGYKEKEVVHEDKGLFLYQRLFIA